MSNEISTIPKDTMAIAEQYLESFGNKLTKQHKNQFLQIASAFNLNPFTREIYGIPYGDKFNIIVGYEVYLKRAETSGQLAGWRAWTEGEGKEMKGCVEITRHDWKAPFIHEVYLSEYDQNNQMWKSKPRTMIKKVAIAQGFRMAFPVELGGIPYTADEMPSAAPEIAHDPAINKNTAMGINNDLKNSGIAAESFLEAFGVTRLGELKQSQLEDVDKWITKNTQELIESKIPDFCNECRTEPCTCDIGTGMD